MKIGHGIILACWLILGVLDCGAWNATMRAEIPDLLESPANIHAVEVESIVAIISGPFAFPAIAAITRGYSDGISYNFTPFPCTRTSEIWCK